MRWVQLDRLLAKARPGKSGQASGQFLAPKLLPAVQRTGSTMPYFRACTPLTTVSTGEKSCEMNEASLLA